MSVFKCKMCGGTIEFAPGATVGTCDHCGTKQTLPRLDDRRANLYDRANHFRRNNEFDKAAAIYEQILTEDPADAEAYWSLVLCRYGIEYVEDPGTHKRVPTVNRAQFTSVFDDEDYKSAVKNADSFQRELYEEEAKVINDIQKGILAISQKEEPFDVFICYKETDKDGRRTPDSVLATELYHELVKEGFKVFFSRITLEDKLGTAYEPYIFAALNSAKVMVVLGTKQEYFNAVWVKNEWSRYLALVKQSGGSKVLIPAYRDMDPYDLPEEFSHLQAQDMSKLGFMQDLLRGIRKIIQADEPKATVRETVVVSGGANVAPLLKRAFMFLEDGEWSEADAYCEKVLDQDPENAEAYLGKLMAELQVRRKEDLANCEQPFDGINNYQKAVRFGDDNLKAELTGTIDRINERNELARKAEIYDKAVSVMEKVCKETTHTAVEGTFKAAAELFRTIPGFKDADVLAEECLEQAETCRKDEIYASARSAMSADNIKEYRNAIKAFATIRGWKDADAQIAACEQRIEEIKAKMKAERLELEREEEERRIAAEKRKKKAKKIASVVFPIVVVCVVLVIVLIMVLTPIIKYNNAVNLYNAGQYEEAKTAFAALNGYKDSTAQIAKCETAIKDTKYNAAVELYNTGKYEEAIAAFTSLVDYKDSAEQVLKCRYKTAVELYNAGKYEEAIEAFSELDGYEDSSEQIENANNALLDEKYNAALDLISVGKIVEAYESLIALDGYRDSAEKAGEIHRQYEVDKSIEKMKNVSVGDYVTFGHYEQDGNTSNGKEEIEWRVLDKEENRILVISKYLLGEKEYGNGTWDTSQLRQWLNSSFLNKAFSKEEQNRIINATVTADKNPSCDIYTGKDTIDKIFCLSVAEAERYFSSDDDRMCSLTKSFRMALEEELARDNDYYDTDFTFDYYFTLWWQLRTPTPDYHIPTSVVYQDFERGYSYIDCSEDGYGKEFGRFVDCVRPAMWIDLGA